MAGWGEDGRCLCSKVDGTQGTKQDLIERSVQCSSLEVGEKNIMDVWDRPGGPVIQTPCSHCRGPRFDPWAGSSIPHAATKCLHVVMKDPVCHNEDQ